MKFNLNDPRDFLQANSLIEKAEQKHRYLSLSLQTDNHEAVRRLVRLAANLRMQISLSYPTRERTLPQNSYLHFLCQYFATEYGCSTAEAKEVYLKRQAAPEIFERKVINRHLKEITTYRSIADLDVQETSSAIRNFIEWAAIGGYELPLPEDARFRQYAENQIERNKGNI